MSQEEPGGMGGFFGLLAALRAFRAGPLAGDPSDRALARAAGVSPTTIGSWLGGTQFPQDVGRFLVVVHTLTARAAARGAVLDGGTGGLLDEDRWREAYRVEARRRAGVVSAAVQRAQAVQALARPSAGRLLAEVDDPFDLEVHRPVQPEDPQPGLPTLPAYVPRAHDTALGSVVRVAAGGRSGIAVLVGGSSTGKTRACWEVLGLLRDEPGRWRLWHPIDPTRPDAALRELPCIGPRTVVWLNEAQFYLQVVDGGLGERVAAGLRELLRNPGRAPVLILATLWPQYWDTLTARPPEGADPYAQARELLAGHDIPVPATFTSVQLGQLARARDARLALAARLAPDGAVTQFLAGAPELLARYRNAPPAAAALISAAMDARRLGMGAALPHAFLQAAAPGYLTDLEWDALGEDWLEQALAYAAVPAKGTRGPLTRIRPRPAPPHPARDAAGQPAHPAAAGGPTYRLADWLDQHGRARRASQIPPAQFWAGAAAYATPADQVALGDAAHRRGLYRAAAQLNKAAAAGDLRAAVWLARPPGYPPADPGPAHWAATHAPLDDPRGVAVLLDRLREAGAGGQAAALLARDPAARAVLDDPRGVAALLDALQAAGAGGQAAALAARAAAHAPLDDPDAVAALLDALREAGAGGQAAALLARDPAAHAPLDDPDAVAALLDALQAAGAHEQAAALLDALLARDPAVRAVLDDPDGVALLLDALREAGAQGQAAALAARAAAHAPLDNPDAVAALLDALREVGAGRQAAALAARAAAHAPLDNPRGVALLLDRLREVGAGRQAAALLARDPAAHTPLDDPDGVAALLDRLREVGAGGQAAALLARDPAAHTPLDNPRGVAALLDRLREAGAGRQAAALLARDPAAHTPLDDPRGVAALLDALQAAGAHGQAAALAARLPTVGMFGLFLQQEVRPDRFLFGREPGGAPAAPWDWDGLD
jgi:uncharacterized protein YidB (DUF937 family)